MNLKVLNNLNSLSIPGPNRHKYLKRIRTKNFKYPNEAKYLIQITETLINSNRT